MDLFLRFIFVLSAIIIPTVINAQDICVERSKCVCVFPNGTGIDLNPASTSKFYQVRVYESTDNKQFTFRDYYFHPCNDQSISGMNASANVDHCGGPISICRHTTVMVLADPVSKTYNLSDESYETMGTINKTSFSSDGRYIKYAVGPSDTKVYITCADTDNQVAVRSLSDPQDIQLEFFSRDACLKQIESGRSVGSTLLIIFFSLLIFYIILGVCTKKFLMGATGIEVIPNLAFWMDLPNLVRDGWSYVLNGFKLPARGAGPVTSPDPNSYDSI